MNSKNKMKEGVSVVLFIVMTAWVVTGQQIAIIGAGIGGGACSYYLHKFGNIQGVNVFESRDYIGGRINEIEFGGQIEEIGADAWSTVNFYVQEISEELGLQVVNSTSNSTYAGNGQLGIWDGEFVDWKKILTHNPVVDFCISKQIDHFIERLSFNYLARKFTDPFTSINQFLYYGNLTYYTETAFDLLISSCNVSEEYANSLIAPIVRAIYDQSLSVQSFGGEVSMVSVYTSAFWVANGNSQLPKQMFNSSGANMHLNAAVTSITWNGQQFELQVGPDLYYMDQVVIAAPIEKTGIKFYNIQLPPLEYRQFVNCYVTHVQATAVNPLYFGLNSSDIAPDVILTSPSSSLPFYSLQVEDESLTKKGAKIYKLFSNENITNNLKDIFLDVSDYHVQEWPYTFPELIPTNSFQPVILSSNLYYLNTIESVASAMEASIISGRNAAQLILQSLNLLSQD